MPNQELSNYVSQARAAGKTNEVIKQELRASGWQETDISEALGPGMAPVKTKSNLTVGVFVFGWLLVPIYWGVTLISGAFADTPQGVGFTEYFFLASIIYPILLIVFITVKAIRRAVWPIVILVLLAAVPVVYIFTSLGVANYKMGKYQERIDAKNEILIKQINAASRDFLCPQDDSPYGRATEEFLFVDMGQKKVFDMKMNNTFKNFHALTFFYFAYSYLVFLSFELFLLCFSLLISFLALFL